MIYPSGWLICDLMLVCRCPDVSVNPKDHFSQHGEHGKGLDFRSSEEKRSGRCAPAVGAFVRCRCWHSIGREENSTAVAHQSARLARTYRHRGVLDIL